MSVIRGSRLGGWRPQALCSRRVPSAPGLSAQEWDPAGLAGHTHSHFDKCSEGFSAPGGHPPPITQPPGSRRDRAWAWFCWVPAACRVLCSYRQPHLILLVTSAWRSALDEQGQEAQTSVLVSQQVQAPGTASGSAQPATLSPASPQMGQRPPHSPFLSKWPLTRVPCTVTSLGTTLPRESMK